LQSNAIGTLSAVPIRLYQDIKALLVSSIHNLNTSDSGLHHTISLIYVGARHLGFGTTYHDRRLGGIGRVVPTAAFKAHHKILENIRKTSAWFMSGKSTSGPLHDKLIDCKGIVRM